MLLLETYDTYRIQKMVFAKQGKDVDKSVIRYNSCITLSGIPLETYAYIVNGNPSLHPRLAKRIVRVSVETVRIVKGLPALKKFKA
jgi:predicted helicase